MSAEAYLDYSLKEFWLSERQPKGLGLGRRRERCSQVSPSVRTGVAKGLMGAGELSRAFRFLQELASKMLTRHARSRSQSRDLPGYWFHFPGD